MRNKQVEELLNKMKKCYGVMDFYLAYNEVDLLLNYIEGLEQLEQENEFLRLDNPNANIKHFEMLKENKRKIDNLRYQNKQLKNKYNKALEILSDYNMPCEYAKPIIPDEYCEENCEVSDEIYKKCWNKHIELTLKGDSE